MTFNCHSLTVGHPILTVSSQYLRFRPRCLAVSLLIISRQILAIGHEILIIGRQNLKVSPQYLTFDFQRFTFGRQILTVLTL